MNFMRILIALSTLLVLVGCGGNPIKPSSDPQTLLQQGKSSMEEEKYDEAGELFRDLLAARPPASIRLEAQFLAAEAAFFDKDYPRARLLYREFQDLYPQHSLAATVAFRMGESFFCERASKDQDVTPLREARKEFSVFINRYPDHPLVSQAYDYLDQCEAALASHELRIAQFYMDQKAWDGAVNRLTVVLEEYPSSPVEDQVLGSLVEVFSRQGEKEAASSVFERLRANYPSSPWVQRTGRILGVEEEQ